LKPAAAEWEGGAAKCPEDKKLSQLLRSSEVTVLGHAETSIHPSIFGSILDTERTERVN
jgi:hypothetical protein